MAFKSSTFKVETNDASAARAKTKTLQSRHKGEMDKVVTEAKNLADDRRRTLKQLTDAKFRITSDR